MAFITCQLQRRHDDMGFNRSCLPRIQAVTCFASSLLLVLRLPGLEPAWNRPALAIVSPRTLLGAAIFLEVMCTCCNPCLHASVLGAQNMGSSSPERPQARSRGKQMLCKVLICRFVLFCSLQRQHARIKPREPCSAREQLKNYSCSEETT